MKWFKNLFKKVDVQKNKQLIYKYWRIDRERKLLEYKEVKYPHQHYYDVQMKLKESLEKWELLI